MYMYFQSSVYCSMLFISVENVLARGMRRYIIFASDQEWIQDFRKGWRCRGWGKKWTFGVQWFCFTLYPCQLVWLQVDTSVSGRNISGAFCAIPFEATPTPTASRDQATPSNYSGEVSITDSGEFVPGTDMEECPSEALSSVNSSVKNTFSVPGNSLGSLQVNNNIHVHCASHICTCTVYSGMLRLATLYMYMYMYMYSELEISANSNITTCRLSVWVLLVAILFIPNLCSMIPQINSIDSCHSNLSCLLHHAPKYGGISLHFCKKPDDLVSLFVDKNSHTCIYIVYLILV